MNCGVMKLDAYLSETGVTVAAFAGRVGVQPATIYRYLNGERFPTPDRLVAIEGATNGRVTSADFLAQREATAVA